MGTVNATEAGHEADLCPYEEDVLMRSRNSRPELDDRPSWKVLDVAAALAELAAETPEESTQRFWAEVADDVLASR